MWTSIIAFLAALIPSITSLGTKTLDNQGAAESDAAKADASAQEELGKEFSYPLGSARTQFDAVMDGLNRMPRPFMAFGTLMMMAWACANPAAFAVSMGSLAVTPAWLQNVFYMIVGFFFSSRMIEKLSFKKFDVGAEVGAAVRRVTRRQGFVGEPDTGDLPSRSALEADQGMPEQVLGLATLPRDDLMQASGFGAGSLTHSGYTGSLPRSRAGGWRNPVAQQYASA